jgi:formamidopyrimidine-DNA glycosylase
VIEIPEAYSLAGQMTKELCGKTVKSVVAGASPHKFAWLSGDTKDYEKWLGGKKVGKTDYFGGRVEMEIEDMRLEFADGVNLTLLGKEEKRPAKHQLLIEFTDGTALIAKVQMYGGLWAHPAGGFMDNEYHAVAHEKVNPLDKAFDEAYFRSLLDSLDQKKLSVKAFLATEQRIPGLGNGVLQDILWRAKLHPKRKMASLTDEEVRVLFAVMKETLREMAESGGRSTEKDLYGNPGGYKTVMSKENAAMLCPACGGGVKKEAYMGGSVYYCPACQRM